LTRRSPSPPQQQHSTNTDTSHPKIFHGTDAVPQNHKVALQRILDVHHALESASETSSERRPSTSTSASSSSSCTPLFSSFISLPNAEVRAFNYLLRLWDPNSTLPDPLFDAAVQPQKAAFEDTCVKHFFGRVALWDASQAVQQEGMRRSFFLWRRRRSSRVRAGVSVVEGGLEAEKGRDGEGEGEGDGALKEVTTREGLAQLLWTLVNDDRVGLGAGGLKGECEGALRVRYGV
ncbi:hypothetical protein BDW02DRAFT_465541, partial [Decorospora gaudefroyi]